MNAKKTLALLIVAIMICFGVSQIFLQTVHAADITTNIIDTVQITNIDGTPLGTGVAKDAQMRLAYDFSIPNTSDIPAGATYTFSIPEQILIQYPLDFTIKDTASQYIIANGRLETNGGIVLTFTDFASHYSNVAGSFWFDLQFNKDKIGNTNPQVIEFKVFGTSVSKTVSVDFNQPPPPTATIAKSGALTAGNEITWSLTVDPENVAISGTQVVDLIPAGQSFIPGSVTVGGSAADPANYSYDGGTSTLTYTFPSDVTSQQVLAFKTKIADSQFAGSSQGSTLQEINTATLKHDGISVASNEASVSVPVNFISKNGSYNSSRKQIDWTITVDQSKVTIPDAVVTDTLPAGLTLDTTSVKIDGSSSSAYTYSSPTITFNLNSIAESHTIQFSTNVDSDFYLKNNSNTYTNSVTLTGTNVPSNTRATRGVGVTSTIVDKQGSSYDPKTGQITWRILVDSNVVEIDNAVITDVINSGQSFVPNSVTINGSAATEGSNYTYNSGTSTLTYTFPAVVTTQQTVTFKTQVTDPAVYAGNVNTTYYNTATLTGSNITSSQDTGSQNVQSQVISKTGSGYDYQTRQISWRITVDANQMPLNNVVITDNVPIGQQFVAGSQSIDGGADSAGFSYADAAQGDSSKTGTLTYTFGSAVSKTYHITFNTTVTDLSIFKTNGDKSIQNTATITDTEVPGGVTTTGSQTVHNTVIGKSASYTSGNQYIDWSVDINTNSITLSTSEITDQLPVGLAMDTSSVKLFQQTINADGSMTKGAEVSLSAQNVQYDLSTRTLHFKMPDPASGSYLLTFRTDVTDKSKSPFTNAASFNGTGSTETGTSQAIAVGWAGSGSTGTGEVGTMNVTKVDSADGTHKLQGAVFQLKDKYGNIIQHQTTDSNGSALFTRLRFDVNYTVEEITPPTGYLITGAPYTFQISGAVDDPKDLFYAYTDDKILGNIQFNKTDGTDPLEGAEFTLYAQSDTSYANPLATETSDSNGIVLFQDVPYGTYIIRETTPPTGYFASTDILAASITDTDNGKTVTPKNHSTNQDQSVVADVPYLGTIQLTKLEGNTNGPLAGAEFTLYKQSDTSFATPLATATSDASGLVEFKNIPYGDYAIKETAAPDGYFVMDTVLTASVTQDGETVTTDPATITDPCYHGNIRVIKRSSFDQTTIEGCTFSLFDVSDTSFSTPLDTAVSDEDGIAEFTDIPYGSYTVRETDPPTGYFISDAVLTASITQDGATVAANPDFIADPPYIGKIVFVKTSTDGTRIGGAVFALYKASDTSFSTPIEMAGSGTTDGTVEFVNVPYGTYNIKEIQAPAGYELNTGALQVQITQDGQTVDAGFVSDAPVTPDDKSPETGDSILIFVAMLAICAAGLTILLITGRKRYRSKH